MEEELKRERDFTSAVIETEGALVVILDPQGHIARFNRACEQTTGYSFDEVRNQYFWDVLLIPEEVERVKTVFEELRVGNIPNEVETYLLTKDRNHRLIVWSNTALLDGEGSLEYIVSTGIDITERKQVEEELRKHRDHLGELVQERTEEITRTVEQLQNEIAERKRAEELARLQQQQLMQADKMVTLGILSSGVAHEINNPNNFILLNAKIFSRVWNDVMPILKDYYEEHGDFALAGMWYTKAHEKIGQLIAGTSEGAQRIAKIVKGLKDFARQDTGDMNQPVDINSVVDAAILIVNNLIKKSTDHFLCECGDNLPAIQGNLQQLEQVIINLITNACQSLDDREKGLFISTSYDSNSESVIVKVRDEGVGISPEHSKHIMDPFFTTKRGSGGTGLGLSISYNIVKAHGGDMEFTSELGEGTTVVLTLPAYQK